MREEDKSNILPTCLKILDRVHNQRNKRESNNYNKKKIYLGICILRPHNRQENKTIKQPHHLLRSWRGSDKTIIQQYFTIPQNFIT